MSSCLLTALLQVFMAMVHNMQPDKQRDPFPFPKTKVHYSSRHIYHQHYLAAVIQQMLWKCSAEVSRAWYEMNYINNLYLQQSWIEEI